MADFITDGKIGIDLTATYASTSAGSTTLWPANPGAVVQTSAMVGAQDKGNVNGEFCKVLGIVKPKDPKSQNLEFEVNWSDNPDLKMSFRATEPPELPNKLSPVQAAQMFEMIEYLHLRVRDMIASVRSEPVNGRVSLEERQWQGLLDIQARLAEYLRAIGDPEIE